jgi:C4-dicarboxylate-specific signal transduction histidine kinase
VQVVVRDVSQRKRAEEALHKAYEELEQRVKDRTADLVVANERLRQEIEEHKRTEQELRDSKTLISAVFASLFGRVAVLDRAGTILAVNDAWLRFAQEHGASSQTGCVGVNYLDVCRRADMAGAPVPAAVVTGIQAVLEGTREEFSLEYPCAPAEPERWFQMVVTPLRRLEGGAIVTHFDITPQRQAELQIQRLSQDLSHFGRVSMMGELAAALAHELRQPLTAVMANAEAGLDVLDAPGVMDVTELREILTDIIAEDHRAGEVIRRLRTLLRRGPSESQPLNLNELINEVIPLLRNYAVMHDVSVTTDLSPALPLARGDRIQLEQVLVNLMLNALDSMKTAPRDRRHLRVRTAPTKPHSVLVTVQDSGTGILPEHLDCIFDSFFTTKPEGMGMGLSICRAIVQAHHGRIWAENNPGPGAAAHFSLPALERDKEGPAPPPAG